MRKHGTIALTLKTILGIFCILLCCPPTFSQVVIDRSIAKKYRDAVKKVPKEFTIFFTRARGLELVDSSVNQADPLGFGIITVYKIDTLNKTDLKSIFSDNEIIILNIDPITGKEIPEIPEKQIVTNPEKPYYPSFMAPAFLKKDSLQISFAEPFGPEIKVTISGKSTVAYYRDYRKNDPIFRLKLNLPKTSDILVPMRIASIKLSESTFKENANIHGEAEFITEPFFSDDYAFTSGYLHQQVHLTYLFFIKIRSSQVPQ